jgi:fructose-bisphosphate aldolase class I
MEGLEERAKEYAEMGCKFSKWRSTINIGKDLPSDKAVNEISETLAKYAVIM